MPPPPPRMPRGGRDGAFGDDPAGGREPEPTWNDVAEWLEQNPHGSNYITQFLVGWPNNEESPEVADMRARDTGMLAHARHVVGNELAFFGEWPPSSVSRPPAAHRLVAASRSVGVHVVSRPPACLRSVVTPAHLSVPRSERSSGRPDDDAGWRGVARRGALGA
jgi:hypothetical protein